MEGQQSLTDIQKFYRNTTVFLTGATGFLGKLILEKILRALPVKKVYILVRSKKNVSAQERFNEIFQSPAFDTVKRTKSETLKKVFIVEGDCSLPMLGLSEKDQNTLKEEVSVIFHAAAIVRFDEQIKKATFTNIRATRDLISLAKDMKKLKTFVYTGTGYSNCIKKEIKEEIYPAKITAESLIKVCENLDNENLDKMTETLIGEWPNTYTFTKQVVEDYIDREARDIPICITRPTIIVSAMAEPATAFVDNIFTLAGFIIAGGLGILRIGYCKNIVLDIVPVDFVVNECIAAGWQTASIFKKNKSYTPVYNISTSMTNPITIDQISDACYHYGRQVPTTKQIMFPVFFRTPCRYNYLILRFILHTIFAYALDLGLRLQGKKPMYMDAYDKVHKFHDAYTYFMTTEVLPHTENTSKLLRKMTFEDRQLFNFDVTTINWENYFVNYPKGLRIYLLKDPLDTLVEGRKIDKKKKIQFAVLCVTMITILYGIGKFLLFKLLPFVFGALLYQLRALVC